MHLHPDFRKNTACKGPLELLPKHTLMCGAGKHGSMMHYYYRRMPRCLSYHERNQGITSPIGRDVDETKLGSRLNRNPIWTCRPMMSTLLHRNYVAWRKNSDWGFFGGINVGASTHAQASNSAPRSLFTTSLCVSHVFTQL